MGDLPDIHQRPPSDAESSGEDYPSSSKAAATLATLVAPFLSLIAALVLMGSERDPVRRASLRRWAWWSGGLIIAFVVVGVIVFASVATKVSGSSGPSFGEGPCVGGPEMGADGVQVAPHRYRFRCAISGSTVVRLP